MTAAMRKKSIQQQAEAAPQLPNAPLTPEERERYNVEERVDKMMKKHNLSREDAEEVVREVVVTKEMPGDKKVKPEPDKEPQPVAKGVIGPLGALLNGQRFYVKGVVGNFILEGWQLAPGVFDANNQLRRVPKVAQITQRRTATKPEVSLKPQVMNAWFEETEVTVLEDFALLNSSDKVQRKGTTNSDTEENDMPKAAKKSAKKTNGHVGRTPLSLDSVIKLKKGPTDDSIKRHIDILTTLKEDGGGSMTVGALAKALAKRVKSKQDLVKVFGMHKKFLVEAGHISVTEPST